jgi:uncharacterized membrane protein YdjX (TVP38/TMEM64 family)
MIIGEETIASWQTSVSEHLRFFQVFLFQAVVPSEIPGYLLGILRYRFPLYLLALGITEIPYAIATVYLGESFLKGHGTIIILVGIGLLILAAFLFQIHRWLVQSMKLRW